MPADIGSLSDRAILLIAFLADLAGVVFLASAGDQNLGGTLQVIDALVAMLFTLGGALAGVLRNGG